MRVFRDMRVLSMAPASSGCTTLVCDDVKRTAELEGHCSGGDDSSIAVLPVPVVPFFVPHVDLHSIKGESYVNRRGASTRVVNRVVSVTELACIPAGSTRIIRLGVWQWCPAHVAWSADVLAEAPRPASLPAGTNPQPNSEHQVHNQESNP